MGTLCTLASGADVEVMISAYECIIRVAELYYVALQPYMDALARLTFGAARGISAVARTEVRTCHLCRVKWNSAPPSLSHQRQDVAVRAVEFWTTVADEEASQGDESATNKKYTHTALAPLMEMLLGLMTKQNEDDTDEQYSIAQAASNCVQSVSKATGDAVLARVVPVVQAWINSADWHQRDAATLALGVVMDGPSDEALRPLVKGALPMLVAKLVGPAREAMAAVRDTTAWSIGNIIMQRYSLIEKPFFASLLEALIAALADEARVAANVAYVSV